MGTETHTHCGYNAIFRVEKMGPLRGDGNNKIVLALIVSNFVEKMGPLRGDGNSVIMFKYINTINIRREDGSPSWGRKLFNNSLTTSF